MAKKRLSGLAFCAGSAATLLLSSGAVAGEPRPLLPEAVISQVLDAEDKGLDKTSQRRLLHLLVDDPRAAVRIHAADATGDLSGVADAVFAQGILRKLSEDSHGAVRSAAARALGQRLRRLTGVSAMSCAAEWVFSRSATQRECIAQAMLLTDEAVWNEHLLEQLITDESGAVRRAATRALSRRYQAEPDRYGWLLSAALTDTDAKVRRLAQRVAAGRAA
ncbi:MAG: hypothetical protein RJA70_1668 [Pseudomonadota bacterium]|jgi:HEAT repeat protein